VERQEKQKVVQLSAVREKCDLNQLTGEQFLKELMLSCDNYEETEEYKIFMSALKALHENNSGTELVMQTKLDRTSSALSFHFKFIAN
jgi:hypothetical protein